MFELRGEPRLFVRSDQANVDFTVAKMKVFQERWLKKEKEAEAQPRRGYHHLIRNS